MRQIMLTDEEAKKLTEMLNDHLEIMYDVEYEEKDMDSYQLAVEQFERQT